MELKFSQIENKILTFWKKNKIFEQLNKKIRGQRRWSFLDGPITANNPMGVHHAWGRTYKDIFQRYKAAQGFDQRFQNGFDCQGLWVEVEVEKELGFKSKKDIEKYGIARFIKKCKERVKKYSRIQTDESIQLGQWMDWDNSYYTLSQENNYAIWFFLKKCWKKGYLYKGWDVVPWCLRCGTAISQHEISQEEYEEISHSSLYLKFPLLGKTKEYLLVWTTTPWTLPANVAVAVHPKLTYLKVRQGDNIYYLAKERQNILTNKFEIQKELLGKDMLGYSYQGPFDDLPITSKIQHKVIAYDEVSAKEGTGLVHIAPGCGQEDWQLSKKEKLKVISPIDEQGNYLSGFGWLTGKNITETRSQITAELNKKDFVYKIEKYLHRYPVCWRCKSELVFRLVDEWYISMKSLRRPMMDITKGITWIPAFGKKRELDWLKNMQDWLISKKRYWGLALPIFECQKCHHFEVIGSKEELKKRAVLGWNQFKGHSPHRPWVDKIKIRCSSCGQLITRIPEVGNPWLDAGIVPFSTLGYFKNKKYWEKWYPPDLICESFPGQFRNWFYSLIAMSTVLENKKPVKTIFGHALVKDQKGEEMHKSKGNAIWLNEAIRKMGVDVLRWIYSEQDPSQNLLFGWELGIRAQSKLLRLWNSYLFFITYARDLKLDFQINNVMLLKPQHDIEKIKKDKLSILDGWILSKLNSLIEVTTKALDHYQPNSAIRSIDTFLDDLSTWYIRRSRSRFQRPSSQKDLKAAAQILYLVLLNLIKLLAPFIPFLTEEIYQHLIKFSSKKNEKSVHLVPWPKSNKKFSDPKLEKEMEQMRQIVNLALRERKEAGIKVRQPLASLKIRSTKSATAEAGSRCDGKIRKNKELLNLIKDEVNVKEIVFDTKLKTEVALDKTITEELKEEGIVRELIRQINALRKEAHLTIKDKVIIYYQSKDKKLKTVLKKYLKEIQKETLAKGLKETAEEIKDKIFEKKIKIEGGEIMVSLC